MDLKQALSNPETRQFILKLRFRKQWRVILAICVKPSQLGAVDHLQNRPSLSVGRIKVLLSRMAEHGLITVTPTHPRVYQTTELGRKVLEAYPIDYNEEQVILRGSSR